MTSADLGLTRRSGHLLLGSVLLLVVTGVVMLFSTCAFGANTPTDDVYFDAKRQIFWLGVGLACCGFFAILDYHRLQQWCRWSYLIALVLLAGCFIPMVGQEINGERRWISAAAVGLDVRIQPSEFAKLALVSAMAAWYAHFRPEANTLLRGFLFPCLIAGGILALIALEVDIGTTAVLGGAVFLMMFLGGARLGHLALGAVCGVAGFVTMVLTVPGRLDRILAILHPEDYEAGVGHQQKMASLAFGSGGMEGLGLGQGRLKMMYMPFAHTDFIFPMIGEELGLVATLSVVLCFVVFTVVGLIIALHAPDTFGKLLGGGIVFCIALQAALNIAVTTGVAPNTGLPLPFVSYGGSHLVASLAGVGCLLNIYRQGRMHDGGEALLSRSMRMTPRV